LVVVEENFRGIQPPLTDECFSADSRFGLVDGYGKTGQVVSYQRLQFADLKRGNGGERAETPEVAGGYQSKLDLLT